VRSTNIAQCTHSTLRWGAQGDQTFQWVAAVLALLTTASGQFWQLHCISVVLSRSGVSLLSFLGWRDDASALNDLEAFYNDPSAVADHRQSPPQPERMKYLLPMPAPCQPHQYLIIYVHTAPGHHSRRKAVRSTWGNVTRWSTVSDPVTLRFVLGRSTNDGLHQQRALAREQAEYGDLVQLDFVDSYRNMTLKAVGALQWLNEFCQNTR